jgi:predicted dehydrogenase
MNDPGGTSKGEWFSPSTPTERFDRLLDTVYPLLNTLHGTLMPFTSGKYVSHVIGAGRVVEVDARLRYVADGAACYDEICFCHFRAESGLVGRVVQDVVTQPARKEALVQGTLGALRWINGYDSRGDAVILSLAGRAPEVFAVPKTRPDDFIEELVHIDRSLAPEAPPSPMALERGLETMLVLAAAHRAERTRRRVRVDYAKGFTPAALS